MKVYMAWPSRHSKRGYSATRPCNAARASSLALLVESSIEGLLLIVRAYRDTAPLMSVAKELETIMTAATPATPRKRSRPATR
jgi:hypothetical protein